MKTIRPLLFLIFIVTLISCQDDPKPESIVEDQIVSTFYFIRHAEKDRSDPEDIDPELNQRGLGRAMHWAEILQDASIDAIYSTDYQRTTMTAAPLSVKQDLTLKYYDPDEVDIAEFKANNLGSNVLVVGHSNSTPTFVNKMLGEDKYGQMDDYDNGSLFIVKIVGNQVTDSRLHFNCNCAR